MKKLLFFLTALIGTLQAEYLSLNKPLEDDILLISIPKSGTHLMMRYLYLLSGKEPYGIFNYPEALFFPPKFNWSNEKFREIVDRNAYQQGRFFFAHFTMEKQLEAYLEHYPKIKILEVVRDLRDVCVSAAYYFKDRMDQAMGYELTFDQGLMFILTNGWDQFEDLNSNVHLHTQRMLDWIGRPNTLLFRFEDLVGPLGNGDLKRQHAALDALCEFLEIDLTLLERRFVLNNLWGKGSWTFRKGKIGAWKEHFKPEHKQEFKKRFGSYLIALGYEEDDNW